MTSDQGETNQSRRNVLQRAGGAIGISLFASGTVHGATGATDARDDVDANQLQQQQQQGERVAMATISLEEGQTFEFRTPLIWVDSGTTVTWVLESGHHSSTAYAPQNDKPRRIPEQADAWDSGILSQEGKTFTHTFDVEGVYDYYCLPHETVGMIGRVIVGTPNLQTQPALKSPQQSLHTSEQDMIKALNTLTRTMFKVEEHNQEHNH